MTLHDFSVVNINTWTIQSLLFVKTIKYICLETSTCNFQQFVFTILVGPPRCSLLRILYQQLYTVSSIFIPYKNVRKGKMDTLFNIINVPRLFYLFSLTFQSKRCNHFIIEKVIFIFFKPNEIQCCLQKLLRSVFSKDTTGPSVIGNACFLTPPILSSAFFHHVIQRVSDLQNFFIRQKLVIIFCFQDLQEHDLYPHGFQRFGCDFSATL